MAKMQPNLPILELNPKQQKRFMALHPWVYANEIIQSDLTKSIEPGSLVLLQSQKKLIAIGYYNRHSLIAFRALSRNPFETIDVNFFIDRLKNALKLRQQYYSKPFYRLIHSEADGLPGLIIDRFDDVFSVQINTFGMENLKPLLIQALQTEFEPKTIFFQNDTRMRKLEGLSDFQSHFIGNEIQTLDVIENNLTYQIDFSSFQKTGWFYDHRENRRKIFHLANNKKVIDYFCYSGGFALQAAFGEAKSVIAVDSSENALMNAKNSAEHLRLSTPIEFVCEQAFVDMDKRIANGEHFDLIILDPPAFVKVKKDLNAGLKGYEKLIYKGLQLLNAQGYLLIASCSFHVSLDMLKECCLNRALFKTNRSAKITETLHAGPDHPTHPHLPESEYLKGFIIWVA